MKKENRNRGFTLYELLGVLAIIGILALIAVPVILKYLDSGKTKYNDGIKDSVELVAKNFYSENKNRMPILDGDTDYVTLREFASSKYLNKDVVDSESRSCMEKSYVIVEKVGKDLDYTVCLICEDKKYIENEEKCSLDRVDNLNATCDVKQISNSQVMVDISNLRNVSKVVYKEKNSVNEKIIDKTIRQMYNLNPGEYTFYIYGVNGQKKQCGDTIKVKELPVLKVSQYYVLKTKYDTYYEKGELLDSDLNSLSKYTNSSWQMGYVYVRVDNFDEFESVYLNGKKLENAYFWITNEGDINTILTANALGFSETSKYVINTKLDRTKPSVKISSSSDKWTNKDVTLGAIATDEGGSGFYKLYGWDYTTEAWYELSSKDTWSKVYSEYITLPVYAKDAAGNASDVEYITAKVDKVKPSAPVITKIYKDDDAVKIVKVRTNCIGVGGEQKNANCKVCIQRKLGDVVGNSHTIWTNYSWSHDEGGSGLVYVTEYISVHDGTSGKQYSDWTPLTDYNGFTSEATYHTVYRRHRDNAGNIGYYTKITMYFSNSSSDFNSCVKEHLS